MGVVWGKIPSEMNEYVLDVKACIHLAFAFWNMMEEGVHFALIFAFPFSKIMEEGILRSEPKEWVLHPLSTSTSST